MSEPARPDAEGVLRLLRERGWTVGAAESLTGGLVAATLVSVPGASASFRGGIVAYATELKARLLGVDAVLLAAEGAVHPEVARQMACGVRAATGSDVGFATTGVAGPDPQDGKAVGTVFVAVSTPETERVEELALSGERDLIRRRTVSAVLALAADVLAGRV